MRPLRYIWAMLAPLCLHYAPDNASLCVKLAFEELGVSYVTQLVDRRTQEQNSPAYRALNPNGLIPVLETEDGPLFETAAILLWISERENGLFPPVGDPGRMHHIQWLMWLGNTVHPAMRIAFNPERYSQDDAFALRGTMQDQLREHFSVLAAATTVDWLDDPSPNILQCYLAPMLRWAALYGGDPDWLDLAQWPRLRAFATRFETRDTVLRVTRSEGLGQTPFSDPSPCDPPEGSAL